MHSMRITIQMVLMKGMIRNSKKMSLLVPLLMSKMDAPVTLVRMVVVAIHVQQQNTVVPVLKVTGK